MAKQAPKGTWRYGVVRRTYRTTIRNTEGNLTRLPQETCYELVEVFDEGKSWTAEAVSITGASRADIVENLQRAIADIEKYDLIREPIINRHIGGKDK